MAENLLLTQMTEIQKEVWEIVETYTSLIIKGKTDEFLEYFHEDYSGWNNIEAYPVDKKSIAEELANEGIPKKRKKFNVIPLKLNVQEKVAIVHYYMEMETDKTENINSYHPKHYTDVLVKKNDQWLLIADHFGLQENISFKDINS